MSAPPKPHLLVVEDEPSLLLTLGDRLRSEGYTVDEATDGETALERVAETSYDLLVLDVMLPGKNGFDVCRDLRQRGFEMPILMLTARTQVVDKVVGLKLGADDYLTKPFDHLELQARIEALLRRARTPVAPAAGRYTFGDIEVDFRRAEVRRDGVLLPLTVKEQSILEQLVDHVDTVVSRSHLIEHCWDESHDPMSNVVDVHVSSLRRKLGDPCPIRTVRGQGFLLETRT